MHGATFPVYEFQRFLTHPPLDCRLEVLNSELIGCKIQIAFSHSNINATTSSVSLKDLLLSADICRCTW